MVERLLPAADVHPDEDLLVEVALGHADASVRESVTSHLTVCVACRRDYDDLAGAVEMVLPAVPRMAPPPRFEGRVLERLAQAGRVQDGPIQDGPVQDRRARGATAGRPGVPRRSVLRIAAAAVLGVAAGAGATAYLTRDEDEPPQPWAAPLLTADGTQVGRASRSFGQGGALLVVEVTNGPVGRRYICRLRLADGTTRDSGTWSLADDRPNSWVVADPGPDLTAVELVAESGAVWASAQL